MAKQSTPSNWYVNEGNKYIYQYPLGIMGGVGSKGINHDYKAMLEFIPMKVDGQTISKFSGSDLGILNKIGKLGQFGADKFGITDVPDESGAPANSGILPKEERNRLKSRDYKGTIADLKTIEPVEFEDNFGQELPQRCYLYMPMTVQQMENVAVGPESLGVVGGTIASVIQGGDATLTGITNAGVKGAVGGVMDFVSGNASKELGSLLANKIASRLILKLV